MTLGAQLKTTVRCVPSGLAGQDWEGKLDQPAGACVSVRGRRGGMSNAESSWARLLCRSASDSLMWQKHFGMKLRTDQGLFWSDSLSVLSY